MPLGTMILPALITPKSSLPSLSLSLPLSSPNYNMQTHTSAHTHTHTHHMLRPAHRRSTSELAAELVICDAAWLDGRGEFSSISDRLHPSLTGNERFSYHNIWGGTLFTRMLLDEVCGSRRFRNEGTVQNSFWRTGFFFCCNWSERKRRMWKRRWRRIKNKKERPMFMHACERASEQPLVQSVHHSRCVSVLSFIMAAGELALLLPHVTKLLITTSILITAWQLQAHS